MSEQPFYIVGYPFWGSQPVKCVSDVVASSQKINYKPDGRLHSRPTGADVIGKAAGQPARYFHSPVGSGSKRPPTSGVWLSAPSDV